MAETLSTAGGTTPPSPPATTARLTVAQALVKFLGAQSSASDGQEHKLFAGCFGIFGHGNVAGIGQALLQSELEDPDLLPYILGRNEQAMVHTAVAYARMKNRLQTYAVSTSIGPGATNMLTGAALATINRLPVLLLPADTFADRSASPLLQELEQPHAGDLTVNDAFRPVSKYFDRIWRPEQLPAALLSAMRVLTDPAETGAVTLCFPQDVQAQGFDWPVELFARRVWHVARPQPEAWALAAAVAAIRAAKRPLIVAGGGVHYSGAVAALEAFCAATGIPVGQSQAGKGTLVYDHPQCLGAIGSTGTTAANAIARDADLVIGIGTRYSDFTTASRTAFANPEVRFVNVNVAAFDADKHAGLSVVADARETLTALTEALAGYRVDEAYVARYTELDAEWDAEVQSAYVPAEANAGAGGLLTQNEVIGLVNELSDPRDVVVCAAGSMPGDLHKLWRTRDPKGYHVEYGYSCMGYEVAGGLGVRLACPDRDVFVMVGDGSYLMMATELVTAVQEGLKIITVLVQNHGYASIGSLSEMLGSQRFGTRYRYRDPETGRLDGDVLPVDLAANAASLGVDVIRASTAAELADAIKQAKAAERSTVIYVETDPLIGSPDSQSWWDVPVSETSTLASTQSARKVYEEHKATQRLFLTPPPNPVLKQRRSAVSTITLGTAPDSWGVWFPSDPEQVSPEVFLADVAEAGYEWIELGPYGFLPSDPAELSDTLDTHGLRVLAGTVFEHLHRPDSWDAVWSQVTDVAALTQAVGGHHIVVIPDPWRDHKTGKPVESRHLPPEQWTQMTRGLDELGRRILDEYGLHVQFHSHADSHVGYQPEIERLLADTNPEWVNLCLDTGHVAYYGGDSLELVRTYPERIGYLHLKQVDPEVVAEVHAADLSFPEAVRRGAMIEPPHGVPDFPPLLDAVSELGHDMYGIIEHDLYPCAPDVPLPIAQRTKTYLSSCSGATIDFGSRS